MVGTSTYSYYPQQAKLFSTTTFSKQTSSEIGNHEKAYPRHTPSGHDPSCRKKSHQDYLSLVIVYFTDALSCPQLFDQPAPDSKDLGNDNNEDLIELGSTSFDEMKQAFTRTDIMSGGQKVRYTGGLGKLGKLLRVQAGQKARLVAIAQNGQAMLKLEKTGETVFSPWSNLKPVGDIKPHSLYDGIEARNTHHVSGRMAERANEVLNRKIGNSDLSYLELCEEFQTRGFTLHVVGGFLRDMMSADKETSDINDVDFVFNGTHQQLKDIIKSINPQWMNNPVINSQIGLVSFTDAGDVVDITPLHKYTTETQNKGKGWNLRDDAHCRDLTINSLQMNPLTGIVVDATGQGISDIKNNVINFCVKANPINVLRALKFETRGYTPSDTAKRTIKENIKQTGSLSRQMKRSFLKRNIADKDGLNGLKAFKETFSKYDTDVWDRAYESVWSSVCKQFAGRTQ